jgi:hypothetical protein
MAWRRDGLQIAEDGQIRYAGNNAGAVALGKLELEFDDETGALLAARAEPVETAEVRIARALTDTAESVEAIATRAGVSVTRTRQLLPRVGKPDSNPRATGGRPATFWTRRAA